MATQLFLTSTVADTHLATDTLRGGGQGAGIASSWTSRALSTSRGSGVVASFATPTLTNATDSYQPIMASSGIYLEWISPPVSADVTISGTITANIWAAESNMSANVQLGLFVDIIRANATATRNSNTLVAAGALGLSTEIDVTTRAVRNFTAAGDGITVNRGDRLRVFVGNNGLSSAATFTWNIGYNGTSAAADGDTYVTFTENFSFESAPGVVSQPSNTLPASAGTTSFERQATPFVAQGNLTEVRAWLWKNSTPTDNLVLEIQSDNSGQPSGSVVGTVATVAGASLTGSEVQSTYSVSISLSAGLTYWLVFRRDGALDSTNYYRISRSDVGSVGKYYAGATWTSLFALAMQLTMPGSVLYLTDTASDVATASVDYEAWTSRGNAAVNMILTVPTGWTAPVHWTNTAGGTVVDWFTKQLQAFTLTGMAVGNLRLWSGNTSHNASARLQIARVDSDGTNATVWADWCIAPIGTNNGEITTTETAYTANVSGDDLAFTNGQRIRIRLYADDQSSAAAAASTTVRLYVDGPTPAASGDTYITLPQSISEFVTATAGSALQTYRQRRAHRFLTTR